MADPSLPAAGTGARRAYPAAIVAGALAAILLLAVLADGRLLIADPDASAVTAADVRLARSLFDEATPPEALGELCIDDEGTIDPACLGDGQIEGAAGDITAEVIPRACRNDASVDAACIEERLGIDLPEGCVDGSGHLDVGCAAEGGDLLVLTDQCLAGGRLELECLTGRVYGVPDPGPEAQSESELPSAYPGGQGPRDPGQPDEPRSRDEPEQQPAEEDAQSGLASLLGALFHGFGLLVLAALVAIVVAALLLAGRRWRPGRGTAVEPERDEEEHDRALMAASLDAGARQLDLSSDARQAIIAAYALLLEGLAACAQGRHPAETPLEHLERVLAALDVRPEPLRDLTTLFGEARFSDHPMTDAHRDRARAALDAAAADLDRVRETVG